MSNIFQPHDKDCCCNGVTCDKVTSCINKELSKISVGSSSNLPKFCDAVAKCVDTQFSRFSQGLSNGIPHFPNAVTRFLKDLPGYSATGDYSLLASDDDLVWVPGGSGGGGITSFSSGNLSPLFTTSVATPTTTPALSFNLNTQSANRVFAGPTSGSAAAPTFRALVAADIPSLSSIYPTGANMGLTKSSTNIQLGQTVGAVGDPALLTMDREIPMGNVSPAVDYRLIFSSTDPSISYPQTVEVFPGAIELTGHPGIGMFIDSSLSSAFPSTSIYHGSNLQNTTGVHWTPGDKHYFICDLRDQLTYCTIEVGGSGTAGWDTAGNGYYGGNVGTRRSHFGGFVNPTATVHIRANASTPSGAMMKFTSAGAALLSSVEAGAFEWDGSRLYITDTTPTRHTLAFLEDIKISSLLAATATNTINNLNFAQEWQWNTLSSQSALKLSSSSTAAVSDTQTLLHIALSGANAIPTQTTYGARIFNTHTGTASTNVGLYASASGGSTNLAMYSDGLLRIRGTQSTDIDVSTNGTDTIVRFVNPTVGSTSVLARHYGGDVYSSENQYLDLSGNGVIIQSFGPGNPVLDIGSLTVQNQTDISGGHMTIGSIVGTFVLLETVTGGTTGATASISSLPHPTALGLGSIVGEFQIGETVTGGTSGATATIVEYGKNKILILNNMSGDPKFSVDYDGVTWINTIPHLATTPTEFLVSDSGVVKYRTLGEMIADIGGGGGATAWNSITDPTGTQTLVFGDGEINTWTNGSNTETFHTITSNSLTTGTVLSLTSSSLTSGNLLSLVSTSTALAANNEALNIALSGANGTASITATGARISVTNTGTTNTNIALDVAATGASSVNRAINTNGAINLGGANSPLQFNGDSGTSGYIAMSGGANNTPAWTPASNVVSSGLNSGSGTTNNGNTLDWTGALTSSVDIDANNNYSIYFRNIIDYFRVGTPLYDASVPDWGGLIGMKSTGQAWLGDRQSVNKGTNVFVDDDAAEIYLSGEGDGHLTNTTVVFIADHTYATATNGDVWTLMDNTTGEGAWVAGGGGSLVIDTTVVTGGSDGGILFDSSGILGEDLALNWNAGSQTLSATNYAGTWAGNTISVAKGGTGLTSYAVGDLIYASGATTLAPLADVAVGRYLRSGGVGTAPLWSTVTLPNSATTGDLIYASASNTYTNLADVAAGSYLRSGGTSTAPLWSTLILPNAATANRIVYATSTNTYGESANLTFDGSILTHTSTVSTGTTTSAGEVLTLNSLTTGTGRYVSTNSQTSGVILNIIGTSTALAAGNFGIDIGISGANGTNNITVTGIRSFVTNTNGTSGTNVAGEFRASGATTANYALRTEGDIVPRTNGASSLGTSSTAFSNLFLGSGGVINFNSGNYTITHSAGTLTTNGTFISNSLFTQGSGLFATSTTGDASDLYVIGNSGSSTTTATAQLEGATTTGFRILERGSSSYSLATGVSFANHIIAGQTVAEFSSGNHPLIASLAIIPPTITTGAATVSNTATLYISAAPSATVSGQNLAVWVKAGNVEFTNGNLTLGTAGNKLVITEGTDGRVGQTTLVSGTKAITINGLTTSSRAFVTLVTPSGTTLTVTYQAVCTANTLTIQANVAAGTINTADGSTLNYFVLN